jgi:hypothetical protein
MRTPGRRIALASALVASTAALVSAAGIVSGGSTSVAPPGTTVRNLVLGLPQEPWAGGSSYYAQFPLAKAGGWADPAFFPIGVWFGRPAHAHVLRSAGINVFLAVEHNDSISTVTRAGIFAIPQRDEWTPAEVGDDPGVVGWAVSDECDMGLGGCTARTEEGRVAQQRAWVDQLRRHDDGRFLEANFGNGVLGTWWAPSTMDDQVALLDVTSVDKYAYTSSHVRGLLRDSPAWPQGMDPRSSAAYGWLQDRMESFSGSTKPNWVLVETARPLVTEDGGTTISGDQIEGAVWSSLIHGAAGIVYFEHNNNGVCGMYSIVECGDELRSRVTAIDAQVTSLARVLNSPSYRWDFGPGLDTSLKAVDGDAYVLAMPGGGAGRRTLTLPPRLAGATSVEVVDEHRSLPVRSGAFTDTFEAEYSHHVYRVQLRP